MGKLARQLTLVCALFAVAAVVIGCGSKIAGDAIVTVGKQKITKAQFQHRLVVTFLGSAAQTPTATAPTAASVPMPPDYKGCIAATKKAAPKPVKGQPVTTDATYKKQCATTYQQLHDSVLQTLIQGDWIAGEAAERKLKVTPAAITKQFNTLKTAQFPKPAAFNKFMKTSGLTIADLRANVELQLLTNKLRAAIVAGKAKITPAQIAAYYKKNKASYGQPEHRALRLVLNKNKAKAAAALKALKAGQSWTEVAKKYSTDPTTKATGGLIAMATKGQEDPGLDKPVFSAKKGVLTGPIKTTFGYYVFEVTGITPAVQQTIAQATPAIKAALTTNDQTTALNKFVTAFQKKWMGRTTCRKDYVIASCKNYKAPAPTSTAAATTSAEPAAPSTVTAPAATSTTG